MPECRGAENLVLDVGVDSMLRNFAFEAGQIVRPINKQTQMSLGIKRLEHIGIATEERDAQALFEQLLGRPVYKSEEVTSEQVVTKFIRVGETKVELLTGTSDNDAITKFIGKKGPGIHHLAFEVEDIYAAFDEAKKMGLQLLNEAPKKGADNKLIFFIHPKSAGGILVEFCQELIVPS